MKKISGQNEFECEKEELEMDIDSRNQSGDLPDANIIVAGITGTGKSTLINAIFGEEIAATGEGRPVTEYIREYNEKNTPIRIWDTVGLELDSEKTKKSIKDIKGTIASKASFSDKYDRIHAIWYCINSGSNRYQGAELEFIKELYAVGVPFIIVLTQCSGDEEKINRFESEIKKINASMGLEDIRIVQVLAQTVKFRGVDWEISPFGLDKLVNVTLELLPGFIKRSFIAAQRIGKIQKREECEKIIYDYVKAAEKGFWEKVPLVNIIPTDRKIMQMTKEICMVYNTYLPQESIERISQYHLDFENKLRGLIIPIYRGYSKKITALLEQKKEEGFSVESLNVNKKDRAARMVAFYGYTDMDSIEELWEQTTAEELKDVDRVTKELGRIINRRLRESSKIGN